MDKFVEETCCYFVLNSIIIFMTIRNFSCGRAGDVCYFAKTDMISHPAFVLVWLGFETGVAEYSRAPVFCFSGLTFSL
jgi:hypothetical protein